MTTSPRIESGRDQTSRGSPSRSSIVIVRESTRHSSTTSSRTRAASSWARHRPSTFLKLHTRRRTRSTGLLPIHVIVAVFRVLISPCGGEELLSCHVDDGPYQPHPRPIAARPLPHPETTPRRTRSTSGNWPNNVIDEFIDDGRCETSEPEGHEGGRTVHAGPANRVGRAGGHPQRVLFHAATEARYPTGITFTVGAGSTPQ